MNIIKHAKVQAESVADNMIYDDFINLYIDNQHSDIKQCFYDYMDAYISIDINSFEYVLDFQETDLYIDTLVNEVIRLMKYHNAYDELVNLINLQSTDEE